MFSNKNRIGDFLSFIIAFHSYCVLNNVIWHAERQKGTLRSLYHDFSKSCVMSVSACISTL